MAPRDDLQRLVDEISALLAAPVTLESREFALIAFCAHDAEDGTDLDPVRMRSILSRGSSAATQAWFESFGIATARGPVRTPADAATGTRTRLCLPVRTWTAPTALLGYVWLLDEGRIDPDPTGAADRERLAAAVELTRQIGATMAARAPAHDMSSALAAALAGSGRRRNEGHRSLIRRFGDTASTVVVADSTGRPRVRGDGRVRVGRAPTMIGAVGADIDDARVLLVPLRDVSDDRPAVAAAGAGPAGLAAPAADIATVAGLRESYQQALYAVRVARARTALGPVVRWPDLGAYRLLRDVRGPDAVIEVLRDVPHLMETAEVFLDCAGNVQKSAGILHVHRQSLYARLSRIETLTGLNLGNGGDRLLLHMSVKLARVSPWPHPAG
ncbi:PucR family transcriptional regulator [uncultured Jatrophihabitans sp.]|uniref:PucR family transcriptional regulator n=1 Tax=uncultured Jatrophihabitans sp. TaxID=1610747 RepID=UPI0035CB8686